MSEITAITFHDCFGAFLHLFGKVWPAIAIFFLSLALYCIIGLLRALWDATIGPMLEAERSCDDQEIDEQCGHDWNPQTMIQDEIDEEA
jgi:hypothetical protein